MDSMQQNRYFQKAPEEFELLSKVPLKHEYIEDVGECHNHMIGVGPVLNIYPWNKELYLIRWITPPASAYSKQTVTVH